MNSIVSESSPDTLSQLEQRYASQYASYVAQHASQLLTRIEEALFDSSDSDATQKTVFNAVRTLRKNRGDLAGNAKQHLLVGLEQLQSTNMPAVWEHLATALRGAYGKNFALLRKVALRNGVTVRAVGPDSVVQALYHWLNSIELDDTTQSVCCQVLKRHDCIKLGRWYKKWLEELRQESEEMVTPSSRSKPKGAEDRIAQAKSTATSVVSQMCEGHPLPATISELVRGPWTNYMQIVLLRHSEQSQEWADACHFLGDLIWAVQKKSSTADVARLQSMLPHMAEKLGRGLETVACSKSSIAAHLDTIYQLIKARVDPAFRHLLHLPSPTNRPRLEQLQRFEAVAPVDAKGIDLVDQIISNLAPGDWFEFLSDDGSRRRAKLSWITPGSGRCLFVEDSGVKVADLKLDELRTGMRNGEVLKLERIPLFRAPENKKSSQGKDESS